MQQVMKYLIILIVINLIILSMSQIIAEEQNDDLNKYIRNDLKSDVKLYGDNKSLQVSGHEDIDIKQIKKYYFPDDVLDLELTVYGKINNSKYIEYWFHIYIEYKKYYHIYYKNGSCYGYSLNNNNQEKNLTSLIENLNTLKVIIPLIELNKDPEEYISGSDIYAETFEKEEDYYFMDSCKNQLLSDWILITEPFDGSTVFRNCLIKGITNNSKDKLIKNVEIQINSNSSNGWEQVSTTNDWSNWNYLWNTEDVTNGKYIIKVRAFDGENYHYNKIAVYVNQQTVIKSRTVDSPSYHIGDYYLYQGDGGGGIGIDIAGCEPYWSTEPDVNRKITDLDNIIVNGTNYEVYIRENEIEIENWDINNNYESLLTEKIKSISWIRVSDLATIKSKFDTKGIDENGKIVCHFIQDATYEYPNGYTMFPLKVGNKWENTFKKIHNFTSISGSELELKNFTSVYTIKYECLRTDTITVPAGTFDVFVISVYCSYIDNGRYRDWNKYNWFETYQMNISELGWYFNGYSLLYYSPEIGNIVKLDFYYGDRKFSQSFELYSSRYGNKTYNPSLNLNFNIQFSLVFLVMSLIIICSIILVMTTEIGKYSFFKAIAPFFAKHKKKRNYEHGYIKGSVRGVIYGNPGENYSAIKKVLGLPNGTLTYYLKALEKEGVVRSERDGFLKRFYPVGEKESTEVLELTEIQKNISNIIKNNPGISQKDILTRLDISQQNLSYHIHLMSDARIIKVERKGRRNKYYIIQEGS